MSVHFHPEMLEINTDAFEICNGVFFSLVSGSKVNRLGEGGWTPCVRSFDAETHAEITIARYGRAYELKSDATKQVRNAVLYVKATWWAWKLACGRQ